MPSWVAKLTVLGTELSRMAALPTRSMVALASPKSGRVPPMNAPWRWCRTLRWTVLSLMAIGNFLEAHRIYGDAPHPGRTYPG